MPDAPSADLDPVALQLLKDNRKIEAIRFIRVKTGAGLVDAKAYVEALERGDPARMLPRPAATGPQAALRGKGGVLLLAAVVAAVLLWMLLNPR